MKRGVLITWASIILFLLCCGLGYGWYRTYTELKSTESKMDKSEKRWLEDFNVLEDALAFKSIQADSLEADLDSKIKHIQRLYSTISTEAIDNTIESVETSLASPDTCFTREEIREFRHALTVRLEIREIVLKQKDVINGQRKLLSIKDSMIEDLTEERDGYIDLYEDARKLYDKDVKKEKRMKNLFMGATPVAFALGVLIVL